MKADGFDGFSNWGSSKPAVTSLRILIMTGKKRLKKHNL